MDTISSHWDQVPKGLSLLADPRDRSVRSWEYGRKENWPALLKDLKLLDKLYIAGLTTMAFSGQLREFLGMRDEQGRDILHILLEEDDDEPDVKLAIFVRLLRTGIILYMPDNLGRTPAHIACDKGLWVYCRWLSLCRTYFKVKDHKGRLPVEALDQYHKDGNLTKEAEEVRAMMERPSKVSFPELASNDDHLPALLYVLRTRKYSYNEWNKKFNGRTATEWVVHLKNYKAEIEFKFHHFCHYE